MVTGAGGAEMSSGSSSVTGAAGAGGAGGAELCRSNGDPCAAAADCCSGLCTNGACAAAPSCAPDGDACSADTDCCSHLCISGACSSGPICAADGDPCSASADCCSEFCSNGACAVSPTVYSTSFEGACPDGWTLTGEWECGVPMNVGPASAYAGTQCIGTQIAGNYSDAQTWDGTTATSPDIDLTNVPNPVVTFRMWIDTEGPIYDGANLQISADGGVTFSIITNVMPAYTLTVLGKPAWGGHQQALGWQLIQADLSAFAGQIVRLRFAFRSDSSGSYAGVYIDDILVN
jgi:hypothetical protein